MRPVLENETVQVARSAVLTVLLILGCAALVNAFLGMILSISGFPVNASAVSIMDGLKRMGYYIGHLMYSSSYRLLLGFRAGGAVHPRIEGVAPHTRLRFVYREDAVKRR